MDVNMYAKQMTIINTGKVSTNVSSRKTGFVFMFMQRFRDFVDTMLL